MGKGTYSGGSTIVSSSGWVLRAGQTRIKDGPSSPSTFKFHTKAERKSTKTKRGKRSSIADGVARRAAALLRAEGVPEEVITKQFKTQQGRKPAPAKPKATKKGRKINPVVSPKGAGLTIPEILAKAEQKVRSLEAEIAKTKQHLAALERDHRRAMNDVGAARNLPRKTALGAALHKAESAKSKPHQECEHD